LTIRSGVAQGRPPESYYAAAGNLAARHGWIHPIASRAGLLAALDAVEQADALYSSMRVVAMARDFAAQTGRSFLLVLSHGSDRVWSFLGGEKRFDQPFVDFVEKAGIPCVDLLEAHRRDFASFRISPAEYVWRYYVPGEEGVAELRPYMGASSSRSNHYNPLGNEFEAFAILPALVGLIHPKPPAYR